VTYTSDDLYTIAELTSEMEVDGHRADIVILKAAIAHAAFEGRQAVHELDILLAAELALPHRLRRQPFEEHPGADDQARAAPRAGARRGERVAAQRRGCRRD
jgi:Mg-chelatase subunit ChlI